ncbi:MAG TPA: 3-oxoacid CoA-transferase subunit A [Candidatus Acidoferrum sp.]
MKSKILSSLDAAVADIPDGARIMFGGFGGAGFPNNLIQALSRKGIKGITAISNNCGTREGELGIMFKNGQVAHVIASFPGPHSTYFQERFAKGEVTCELVPQGILCERMRTAAAGLLGFYTTVGVGTEVAIGKEERVIDGKRCILESPIHADYALIKAEKVDELGNLTYRLAARNFNPIMAMAAKLTIVEADEIVPVGAIEPENVITPAIFVHRIVRAQGMHFAG